jgi:WD40 repeat protein
MNIVNTYGTATPRYTTNLLAESETVVDLPVGACISRWDIQTQQRLQFKKIHSDVVTFIGACPTNENLIATTAYCGEVRLWNTKWEPVSALFDVKNEKLCHAIWSLDGKYIALCSEGGEGLLTVLSVSGQDNNYSLAVEAQLVGHYEYACFDTNTEKLLTIWQQRRIKDHTAQSILFAVNPSVENLLVELRREVLQKDGPQVTIVQPNEDYSQLALGFQDRTVTVLSTDSMQQVAKFKPENAGFLKCMIFENNSIIIRTRRGFSRYAVTNESHVLNEYATPSVVGNVFYIGYAKGSKERVWIGSDAQVYSINLYQPESNAKVLNFHNLTCCGVDFSLDGKFVVSGDFSGNVIVWKVKPDVHTPFASTNIEISVRSLCCRSIDEWLHVYIGALDGTVYVWKVNTTNQQTAPVDKILTMCDTITVMKWQHGQDSKLLALGTSDGMLCIVEHVHGVMRMKLAIVAHKPIKENTDSRFGSIAKYSEVWSLAWSPCNQFIATCSEDQTTCIWNMYGEKMHMLTGHTTAVTSVEWRFVQGIGEVMVTCADDCRAMVWKLNTQNQHVLQTHSHHANIIENPNERQDMEKVNVHIVDNKNRWGLYHVFKTDTYGLDWHTLTYLALEKQGSKLACATQNGYMFVWDLMSQQLLARGKMHNGSIEGLSWCITTRHFASVSSDCTINVYDIE